MLQIALVFVSLVAKLFIKLGLLPIFFKWDSQIIEKHLNVVYVVEYKIKKGGGYCIIISIYSWIKEDASDYVRLFTVLLRLTFNILTVKS